MVEYISREGYQRLQAELQRLLSRERPTVVNQVAAAAAEGDRSENAEYIYGKKRLREIDKRIELLNRRVQILRPLDGPRRLDRVDVLSWVVVEDDDEVKHAYCLVGADETDAKEGLISYHSPVGQALLGREVGDEIRVRIPKGTIELAVISIHATRPPV
ncbi:GreA/GreB family elongation factor [Myxococcota bacterium]|nr:GreA/GreB family elongation factor [Myxococcota bacterium]MBU1430031.1 GreA/GreB family elongation factor [Myxococcota bacterium]MBU1899428.1 GreA/GreB family elongation factor [Myxococcota bacterium]